MKGNFTGEAPYPASMNIALNFATKPIVEAILSIIADGNQDITT